MCLQGADESLLVLFDLGGDCGKDAFFVVSEEGDDVVLDVQLTQVAEDEGLPVVQFALAGDCISLHLLDLLVDLLEGVAGVSAFGCSLAIGHINSMEWGSQTNTFIYGLLYPRGTAFQFIYPLIIGIDRVDILLEADFLIADDALFHLMRLDHIFDHVVELAHADDAVVEALDLAYELFDVLLNLA